MPPLICSAARRSQTVSHGQTAEPTPWDSLPGDLFALILRHADKQTVKTAHLVSSTLQSMTALRDVRIEFAAQLYKPALQRVWPTATLKVVCGLYDDYHTPNAEGGFDRLQ
ncbi:hypothetical protein WJX72_005567 [[Myrmecia] bisecta]|uniref:F-box domain-containing protein n=1 Tax=[Myrmecia] bisecta TaxID=41462 RepID=A0AAW1PC91_9CHLO